MLNPGIIDLLQWASGFVLAIPLAVIGVEFISGGRPYAGAGFILLGIALFFLPEYVARRVGGPRTWIRRWLGQTGEGERP